ncbi:MAG: hypothetical protein Q9221_008401 [Calogaya cf. arnoldii]
MPRKYHKMPDLPEAIDDPKIQELMSHYFATSNHDSDHEGFADMFTADGEYSMNDRKAKGREAPQISHPFPIPPHLVPFSQHPLPFSSPLPYTHLTTQTLTTSPEIIALRRGLWSHIPIRDHIPAQIYTHGHDQLQLMSRGTIKYKHHMGHETGSEWAAYYQLEKDEKGEPKFKKIHIIAVSASLWMNYGKRKERLMCVSGYIGFQ